MGKEKYEFLMGEMDNILETVEKFPGHLQKPVFDALHSALMDGNSHRSEPNPSQPSDATPTIAEGIPKEWDAAKECKKLVDEYALRNIPAISFAALVAYVYTVIAPDNCKLAAINAEHFEEACVEVGRDIGNSEAALYNAKRDKHKYLQGGKKEGYTLTNQGKNYVRNTLLKPNN